MKTTIKKFCENKYTTITMVRLYLSCALVLCTVCCVSLFGTYAGVRATLGRQFCFVGYRAQNRYTYLPILLAIQTHVMCTNSHATPGAHTIAYPLHACGDNRNECWCGRWLCANDFRRKEMEGVFGLFVVLRCAVLCRAHWNCMLRFSTLTFLSGLSLLFVFASVMDFWRSFIRVEIWAENLITMTMVWKDNMWRTLSNAIHDVRLSDYLVRTK